MFITIHVFDANTNLEDARLAAELGVEAVGFVFAPSKRRVTAEQVAEITRELPEELRRRSAGWGCLRQPMPGDSGDGEGCGTDRGAAA